MRISRAAVALAAGLLLAACSTVPDEPATGPPDGGDAVEAPPAGAGLDYQLGGSYPPPDGVGTVVRQYDDDPEPGLYSVCYVNAFQTEAEPDGPDGADSWPAEVVWDAEDPMWPGEHPIDLSTPQLRDLAAAFVTERLQRCAEAGFDAVELDNLDTYERYPGAPWDRDDTIAYATSLVRVATGLGLAVGQKNTTDLLDAAPEIGFTFAVVEECGEFDECEAFAAGYGDHVLAVEYTATGLAAACVALDGAASVVRRDLDLVEPGEPGYLRATC